MCRRRRRRSSRSAPGPADENVVAGSADEEIVAVTAEEAVAAGVAEEAIVARVARHRVPVSRTDHVLDAGELIPAGAADGETAGEVDSFAALDPA